MQWVARVAHIDAIAFLWRAVDVLSVMALVYFVLALSTDRRTLLMVRGFIVLLVAHLLGNQTNLRLLTFVLDKLIVGAAVAMAVLLQPELRRFLEQLGRGNLTGLLLPVVGTQNPYITSDNVIDELLEAIVELSQNRTGALLAIETGEPIDERAFSVPGVRLNAVLSKELLQTIFQTSTLLHDGAVWLRDDRVLAAGVILPISERAASREIGTRHRAAMGLTERVSNCFCLVVSEETGSIAIAEHGKLDRPVTSGKLREFLETKFVRARPTTLVGTVPKFARFLGWLGLEKLWKRKSPIGK